MNNTPAYLIQNKNCRLNGDVSLMLRCHIVETRNIRSKERFTKNKYLDKKTACNKLSCLCTFFVSFCNLFLTVRKLKKNRFR